MANEQDQSQQAGSTQTTAPATAASVKQNPDYGFVAIVKGKQIAVTDDGIGGEHPYEQPNDTNSLDAEGKPKGKTTDKYNSELAWVQANSGHAEVIITPDRIVLVNLRAERIAHKLQQGELVRCNQKGEAL